MPEIELFSFGVSKALQGKLGSRVITASFEATSVMGEGNYHSPHLHLPLKLETQTRDPNLRLTPLELDGQLYLGFPASSPPAVDTLVSHTRHIISPRFYPVPLRLPLTPREVERIEESRTGKDLPLSLVLNAMLAVRSAQDDTFTDIDYAWGESRFTIPRSHWVDHILPRLGYLAKYLLEIDVPVASELKPSFDKALKEFADAQDAFRRDDYPGVLVNCRNAIDALVSSFPLDLKDQQASFANRVKAFGKQYVQPMLSSEAKTELITEELLALWPLLSAETKPGPFIADRLIAKHVLQATANLLSYLGKVFST